MNWHVTLIILVIDMSLMTMLMKEKGRNRLISPAVQGTVRKCLGTEKKYFQDLQYELAAEVCVD